MTVTPKRARLERERDGKPGISSALQKRAACHRPTRFGLLLVPLQPRQLFNPQAPSSNVVSLLPCRAPRVALARVRSVLPFLSLAFKAAWAWLARSWSVSLRKVQELTPPLSLRLVQTAQQSFQFVCYSSCLERYLNADLGRSGWELGWGRAARLLGDQLAYFGQELGVGREQRYQLGR